MKVKLILQPGQFNSFTSWYLEPLWREYFDIELYDETKTYKPCAFYQPMLIVGRSGALELMENQGFETFDNIFDESYDQEIDFEKRLHIVLENLNRICKEPYSDLTWKKLKHNHHLFFNEVLVKDSIVKEIIEPILEYAET